MRQMHFYEHRMGLGGIRPLALTNIQELNAVLPEMPVLVICPAQLEAIWKAEFERYRVRGEIISYQRALRYSEDARYKVEQNPTIVILDEPKVAMTGKKTREAVAPLLTAAEHVFVLN